MTQKRRRRSRKWVSWLVFLALIIAAVVVCYFVWDAYFRDKKGDKPVEDAKTSTKVEKEEEAKKEEKEQEEKKEEVVEKEKVVQYDGGDPNDLAELTGVVTYAGVVGENLMVRVNIDQYLSGGSCVLSVRRDGAEVYGEEVPIVDSASTATCEGFNVPVSRLGSGAAEIVIKVQSGEKSGVISGRAEI